MSSKAEGGIRILPGGGGAPGGSSGAFIRRFVSVAGVPTLAGDTATAQDGGGGTQPVLFGPGQVWSGFTPGAIAAGLVPGAPASLHSERVRAYRLNGVPFVTLARINGTLLAPTEPLAGQVMGEYNAGGYDTAASAVQFGAGARIVARNNWGAADRSSFVRIIGIPAGTIAPLSVLEVEATAVGVSEVRTPLATGRYIPATTGQLRNPANTLSRVEWDATGLGFFGTAPIAQPTAVGARGGNAALASLLTQLAALGLIIDGTTP